ncbi:hypothetical protein ARMSODRAFT_978868 [Armillaria solidipes]|uniref:Uncharacterized protein n=1 Tax=Armillaria solidipes TaxID=1076256 RepID=A0A2H3B104_9AGAR|nr:hypothetical protein ARMSODRAFT_978868 [Armillaria solidipes]
MLGRRQGRFTGALEFRQIIDLTKRGVHQIEDMRTGRKEGMYPGVRLTKGGRRLTSTFALLWSHSAATTVVTFSTASARLLGTAVTISQGCASSLIGIPSDFLSTNLVMMDQGFFITSYQPSIAASPLLSIVDFGFDTVHQGDVQRVRGDEKRRGDEPLRVADDVRRDSSWRESPLEEASGAENSAEHGCSTDDQCITMNAFMLYIVRPVHTSHVEATQAMWDIHLRMSTTHQNAVRVATEGNKFNDDISWSIYPLGYHRSNS